MENLVAFLPYALLFLLCPLMMLFMGHGHDHEHDHQAHHRTEPTGRAETTSDEVHS